MKYIETLPRLPLNPARSPKLTLGHFCETRSQEEIRHFLWFERLLKEAEGIYWDYSTGACSKRSDVELTPQL